MTIKKYLGGAGFAAFAIALSSGTSVADPADKSKEKEWHSKSDFEKGKDQIKAQSEGKVYADPIKDKALNDAMNEGASLPESTDKSKPSSGDTSKAKSSDSTGAKVKEPKEPKN